MFPRVVFCGSVVCCVRRFVRVAASGQTVKLSPGFVRSYTDRKDGDTPPFDVSLLDVLVCPLSKKKLRYDSTTNELINEELGIAYPISNGIPNMIPQEARLLQKDASTSSMSE